MFEKLAPAVHHRAVRSELSEQQGVHIRTTGIDGKKEAENEDSTEGCGARAGVALAVHGNLGVRAAAGGDRQLGRAVSLRCGEPGARPISPRSNDPVSERRCVLGSDTGPTDRESL